jgi:bifunctional ADP-heptose synthase (sugar kinase/adenylyltransferase)
VKGPGHLAQAGDGHRVHVWHAGAGRPARQSDDGLTVVTTLGAGAEVEIVAWRPRRGGSTTYCVRPTSGGTEGWLEPTLRMFMPTEDDATVRDPDFVSIIKQRYVEPVSEGKDLSKLFSVNFINADAPNQAVTDRVLGKLEAEIKNADLVVLADFGHGLMQQAVRDFLQDSGVFLALNCQTNSNNHGFNIISRQYRRADVFSLDEQEMLLSCGHRHVDFAAELDKLRTHLGAQAGWLTRGAVKTIGLDQDGNNAACPPLGEDITDTIGAGDAFFSVVSLAARNGLSVDVTTFLGQLAGAQAVKIVGNREPISKAVLLKSGMSLLNRDPA